MADTPAQPRLVMPAWDESPEGTNAAMRYVLERMSAQARDVGATLVVLYIPLGLPGAGEPRTFMPPAEALRGAIPRSVITVDSRPALRTAPIDVSLRVSDLDRQPSAAANALIADAVAPTVRSLLSRAAVGTGVP